MEFLPKKLDEYIEKHTSPETEVLSKLNRDTYANVISPRMLSGHLQGRVQSMLSNMIKPKNILEIGTFTGYSALCWAEGLQAGGKVYTIDINEELHDMVLKYIELAGMKDKIEPIVGNALEVIPKLDVKFDLVFIDADKDNYLNYYKLMIAKLPIGAYVVADNVLWSGKVVEEIKDNDKDTKAIMEFNDFVQQDNRVENVLFPIRDGLMVMRKIRD